MKMALIVIFISLASSIILNRILFFNFLKSNNLSSNPEQTSRFISVRDVASFYRKSGSMNQYQDSHFKKFEVWELVNIVSIPLIFLLSIIGVTIFSV